MQHTVVNSGSMIRVINWVTCCVDFLEMPHQMAPVQSISRDAMTDSGHEPYPVHGSASSVYCSTQQSPTCTGDGEMLRCGV